MTRSPATLGEKCGGVEYIFNEISPSDLGPKDPWLSYGTSSDHLDNSFRPLSDPSILSGGLTNDNAIAMPGCILTLPNFSMQNHLHILICSTCSSCTA